MIEQDEAGREKFEAKDQVCGKSIEENIWTLGWDSIE